MLRRRHQTLTLTRSIFRTAERRTTITTLGVDPCRRPPTHTPDCVVMAPGRSTRRGQRGQIPRFGAECVVVGLPLSTQARCRGPRTEIPERRASMASRQPLPPLAARPRSPLSSPQESPNPQQQEVISPAFQMALEILRRSESDGNPWVRPHWFAEQMWPDSPSWERQSRVGRGSTAGVGIRQRAGSFLMSMTRSGLVRHGGWQLGYQLTEKGRQVID